MSSRGDCGLFPSAATKSDTYWFPKDRTSSNLRDPQTLHTLTSVATWSTMLVVRFGAFAVFLAFVFSGRLHAFFMLSGIGEGGHHSFPMAREGRGRS